MDYDNIAVMFLEGNINGGIGLSRCDIFNAIATMRILKCMKLLAVQYYEHSVMVTECTYDSYAWKSIWKIIQNYYCQGLTNWLRFIGKTNRLKEMLIFTILANFVYFPCISDRNLFILLNLLQKVPCA